MNSSLVVQLTESSNGVPVFCIPSAGATFFSFMYMARGLKSKRPVYAFDPAAAMESGKPGPGIKDIAAAYVEVAKPILDNGPCHLVGHCWGGVIAFEMAAQLEGGCNSINSVVMLETFPPKPHITPECSDEGFDESNPSILYREIEKIIQSTYAQMEKQLSRLPADLAEQLQQQTREQIRMCSSYEAVALTAPVFLVRTPEHPAMVFEDWASILQDRSHEESMPGDTYTMLTPPNVAILARKLDRILEKQDRLQAGKL